MFFYISCFFPTILPFFLLQFLSFIIFPDTPFLTFSPSLFSTSPAPLLLHFFLFFHVSFPSSSIVYFLHLIDFILISANIGFQFFLRFSFPFFALISGHFPSTRSYLLRKKKKERLQCREEKRERR